MPELPEMEAWRRQLDEPVAAFPVAKAGPAHIATLKTFDPPLAALEGRRFRGAQRRGKRLLFPTDDGELVQLGDDHVGRRLCTHHCRPSASALARALPRWCNAASRRNPAG
jgi:hypothetical protein